MSSVQAAKPQSAYVQIPLLLCPDLVYDGECTNPLCEKGLHVQAQYLKAIQAECVKKGVQAGADDNKAKACRKVCNFHFNRVCKNGGNCSYVHVTKNMLEVRQPPAAPADSAKMGVFAFVYSTATAVIGLTPKQ